MHILITGGLGFIGHNLADFLSNFYKVTIFDNFTNSNSNLIDNFKQKNLSIIKGDVLDYDLLCQSLSDVDCVIHLAAQIDVQKSIKDPDETFEINVHGTENLLNACLKNNICKIIAASSAAVFGNPLTLPLNENSSLNPISPYGKSKMLMEEKIYDFSLQNNINSICLRFFNIYGKNQSLAYAGVITNFLQKIVQNEPLTIFGEGNQTRDFIAVEDVLSAIHCSILNMDGKFGKIYNVGTGNSITINKLAKLMLDISGKNLPINHVEKKTGDVIRSETSIDLIKDELNFLPKIDIKKGLESLMKDLT